MEKLTRLKDGTVSIASWVDEPLYDDMTIGAAANVSLDFFQETISEVTEVRTNMTQPGQLPGNYYYHKNTGIKLQLTDVTPLLATDVKKFLANSTYLYKRAGTDIKWGFLSEFFKNPDLYTMAPAIASTTTLATASFPHQITGRLKLNIADVIESGDDFSFSVRYVNASGVASFTNTRLAVYFTGVAVKAIKG